MNFIDDITDFLVFVVLFAAFSTIGLELVLPEYYDSVRISQESITDKTAPTALGYVEETNYRGELSFAEVLIMTQIQDISIPAPKRYAVGNTVVEIGSEYRAELDLVWREVMPRLATTPAQANQKFYVHYNPAQDRYDINTVAP